MAKPNKNQKALIPTPLAPARNCAVSGVPAYAAKNFNHDKKATGLDGAKPFAEWEQGGLKGVSPVFVRMTEEGDGGERTQSEQVTSFAWTPEELRTLADECERKNCARIALVHIPNFSLGLDRFEGACVSEAGSNFLTLSAVAAEKARKRNAGKQAHVKLLETAALTAVAAGLELGSPGHKAIEAALLAALPA